MSYINIARLVWWAEAGRDGQPIDFLETYHTDANAPSDHDYMETLRGYQLSVNLTRRPTGARILTGRAVETMLAGGVLLEEDSFDIRYFFKPGIHFVPFTTVGDLRRATAALLADPARRHRMAAAGHDWAAAYCTGRYFWAGMLNRLLARGAG